MQRSHFNENPSIENHMMKRYFLTALILMVMQMTGMVSARPVPPMSVKAPSQLLDDFPRSFVTDASGRFGEDALQYRAVYGETIIRGETGEPQVSIFSTSYVRTDSTVLTRPIIFIFNGGPGYSSASLHMLFLGPKRMMVPQDPRNPLPAEPDIVANSDSVIDVADLVFFDPPETGFSRILLGVDRGPYFTTQGDTKVTVDFIDTWLRDNGRTESPIYVMGESYGSIRAVTVVDALSRKKTKPTGVILIGNSISLIETTQRAGNTVSDAVSLPLFAMTAAYHGKADAQGRSLGAIAEEAYSFAMKEYLPAVMQIGILADSEKRIMAGKLEAMTGISASYFLAHELRISQQDFRYEFLREKGLLLGRYDARYTGPAPEAGPKFAGNALGDVTTLDAFDAILEGVEPVVRRYYASDLNVSLPMNQYAMMTPVALTDWLWGGGDTPFADYDWPGMLRGTFSALPRFRGLILGGYYDTTSTVGMSRFGIESNEFPRDRLRMRNYVGGHLFYTDDKSRAAAAAEIREFLKGP